MVENEIDNVIMIAGDAHMLGAGDGVSNLFKYAFGLDPKTPARQSDYPMKEFTPDDSRFRMQFDARQDPRDIEYVAEISHDLDEWNPADVVEV